MDPSYSFKAGEGPLLLGGRDFPSRLTLHQSHKAREEALSLEVKFVLCVYYVVMFCTFCVCATVLSSTRGVRHKLFLGVRVLKRHIMVNNAKCQQLKLVHIM